MTAPIEPSACRWCDNGHRTHCTRWAMGRGLHQYEPPEQWQIKARMLARRAATVAGGVR